MDYTLWEFLQSDIAAKAHQFAGSRELRHIPIESVSVQELPVDDFIQKDELVLSTAVGCLHDAAAFLTLVRSVKDAGAAALFLAFRDTGYVIPPEVIKFADSLGLPLFSIPWERRFSDIQTAVNSAVRKKKLSVYQDLQAALFNAYFDVKPIDHAVSMISKTLHVPTVIMDTNHRILAQTDSIPENDPSHTFHELEICTGGMLAGYLRLCTEAAPPVLPALPESPAELLQKYVCFPLSLWFNRKSIEDLTTLRLKNDFVWDLAHKTDVPRAELLRQGAQLHFDLNHPYTCALLRAVPKKANEQVEDYSAATASASARIEDLLIHEGKQSNAGVMVASRNLDFIMYLRTPSNEPEKYIEHFWDHLHHQLTTAYPLYSFYCGISEISQKIPEFSQLYQNAALALQYCLHSNSTQYCFTYRDTKEAQIVSALSSNENIRQIATELLLPLRAHGSDSSLDLLDTLSTFIRCNYNTSQTARVLHIHRQSLLYRLEKIKDLTGLSLDDHKDLFLLEISLRVFSLYL